MELDGEHAKRNEQKWDRRAFTFDQKRFDYFRWIQRWVIRRIGIKPGQHFLDIGCGTGWAVRYAALQAQGRGEFHGVDLSGEMIAAAQAQSLAFSNVHFHKANAECLPVPDDSVDVILCTNSFHHYRNPVRALTEINRVLIPGGRVWIVDVATDDGFMRWVDHRVKSNEPEHVHFQSSREYRELFSSAGITMLNQKWLIYPLRVQIGKK